MPRRFYRPFFERLEIREVLSASEDSVFLSADLIAAQLEAQYGFSFNRSYYQNEFGFQDKALYGRDSQWYHLRPDGQIFRSGNPHVYIATVDPRYYADPELLFTITEPQPSPPQPAATDPSASVVVQSIDALFADPSSASLVGPSVAREAEAPAHPVITEALSVQARFHFVNNDGHFYEDDPTVRGGKWFQDPQGNWHVMVLNEAGTRAQIYFFRGRSIGESSLVAEVDAVFHSNPEFLLGIEDAEIHQAILAALAAREEVAAREAAEVPPVLRVSALGAHQARLDYEGITREGIQLLILPGGARVEEEKSFLARAVAPGSGSVAFFLPGDTRETEVEALLYDTVRGRELTPRTAFTFQEGRFTRLSPAVENHPEMYQEGTLTNPVLRSALSAQLYDILNSRLAPTGTNAEALGYAAEMVSTAIERAFIGRLRGEEERSILQAVDEALHRHRRIAEVGEFVRNMPEARAVLTAVEGSFDDLYARYSGATAAELQFLREEEARAAAGGPQPNIPGGSALSNAGGTLTLVASAGSWEGSTDFQWVNNNRVFVFFFAGNRSSSSSGSSTSGLEALRDSITNAFSDSTTNAFSTQSIVAAPVGYYNTNVADARQAVRQFLSANGATSTDRIVLIGHSYGGNMAYLLASDVDGRGTAATALVTLDPIDWAHISNRITAATALLTLDPIDWAHITAAKALLEQVHFDQSHGDHAKLVPEGVDPTNVLNLVQRASRAWLRGFVLNPQGTVDNRTVTSGPDGQPGTTDDLWHTTIDDNLWIHAKVRDFLRRFTAP